MLVTSRDADLARQTASHSDLLRHTAWQPDGTEERSEPMAGRPGRRGGGRIRQLKHTKGRRYQASYVWPPMTTARHNALTTFSTRALAERWLASERQLI